MIKTSSDLPRTSSATVGYLTKSLVMLGNFRKMFGDIANWCGLQTIFGVSSKIFGKSSKTLLSISLYNKQNNKWLPVDMEYLFSCST